MRLLRTLGVFACTATLLWGLGCRDDGGGTTSSTGGAGGGGGAGGVGGLGPTQPLKILNWNLKNFYNDKADSPDSEETVVTAAVFNVHVQSVAAVIADLDPDVMIFSEVENVSVLEALDDALDGAYPQRTILESNDFRGLDVGAMSKISFDEVVAHKSDRFAVEGTDVPQYRFARDCTEFHLTYNGRRIALLGVHYRSKGPPDDPAKRLAEAQRCRAIADEISEEDPELGVIILGDFNDLPDSPPVQWTLGEEPDQYVNAADSVPNGERYTFVFQNTLELIDHQIANPLMAGMLDESRVVIAHGSDVDAASDHAPLMATYDIR